MRARETLHYKRCERCGQLTHRDELIISQLAEWRLHLPIRICLFCVEQLSEEGRQRREKLRAERRASSVPRPKPSLRIQP